jgi:multidrug efflux pump subunit AcrA (membrane-fusion protein)
MNSPLRRIIVLLVLFSGLSCNKWQKVDDAEANVGSGASVDHVKPRKESLLNGRIVATNATSLRAPQNSVKIGNWQADHAWIRLQELKKEGEKVKKGDVVARFKFWFEKALPYVQRKLRRAKANAAENEIRNQRRLEDLLFGAKERVLDAASAELDTHRARAISRRQLELYKISHKQALFQATSLKRQIAAYRRKIAADNAYHKQNVEKAEDDHQRYFRQKEKYTLKAPHDGVVRHTYNRRRRRKIKSGDGMPSGLPVVLIAKDNKVRVRFFIPEHKRRALKIGDTVEVLARSGEAHKAAIQEIEAFPQEMGFLREDQDIPDARDKAFAVIADFKKLPTNLPAGSDIRVRLTGETT